MKPGETRQHSCKTLYISDLIESEIYYKCSDEKQAKGMNNSLSVFSLRSNLVLVFLVLLLRVLDRRKVKLSDRSTADVIVAPPILEASLMVLSSPKNVSGE